MLPKKRYNHLRKTVKISFNKLILFTLCATSCLYNNAQNCTVNAGFDQAICLNNSMATSINDTINIINLYGNSAGNVNIISNRLWELIQAPIGANIVIANPTALTATVKAKYSSVPNGVYLFRIGMDCQNGIRAYDTVKVDIVNIADFQLFAAIKWSNICGNTQDSIKIVARPLRTNETLFIYGGSVVLTNTNANVALFSNFNGPTADSIRFTIKNSNTTLCSTSQGPIFRYNINNGSCADYGKEPIVGDIAYKMENIKPAIIKNGTKKTDTLKCIESTGSIERMQENICVIGGFAGLVDYSIGFNNITIIKLSGSGTIAPLNSSHPDGIHFNYAFINNFDTLTPNTLHSFEVTYNSNGCFATFKDTIKLFYISTEPNLSSFTFTNLVNNGIKNYCISTGFPLTNFNYPLILSGTIPSYFNFNSKITSTPSFSTANITNPTSKDTLRITGNLRAGLYTIRTTVTDVNTGCVKIHFTKINLQPPNTLPILRDTIFCPTNTSLEINYPNSNMGNDQYIATKLAGPGSINVLVSNNKIIIGILSSGAFLPGNYTIRISPNPSGLFVCNDGRSDTFNIIILSRGFPSNGGTDQNLICNINSTFLAGSAPSISGGLTGFWKFLPAISSNAGAPIVISDSALTNPNITGFLNLSTYYFSWNVTESNTGNYCNLKPDTIFIIYSGISPSPAQGAQPDFNGCLPVNGIYNLTSNAPTPTFTVLWKKISGGVANIVNANMQNTNITNLAVGNYSFELTIQNSCGLFKDTVNLSFADCPLSVHLLNFSGQAANNTDVLKWQVTKEVNLKNYQIEISANGLNFETLASIDPNITNTAVKNYSIINNNIIRNLNYYKLKSINTDGSFSLSQIIKINRNPNNLIHNLEVYPIPAKKNITINYHAISAGHAKIKILNTKGQTVLFKTHYLLNGINSFTVNIEHLTRGTYFLFLNSNSKKIILQ